jgi:hypothetical protein
VRKKKEREEEKEESEKKERKTERKRSANQSICARIHRGDGWRAKKNISVSVF